MSVSSGPKLVTDGLVFSYDMNSLQSYKGPSISNLTQNIQIIGTGTATGYSSTATTQTEFVPGLGSMQVYINNIQNNYTSFTPNSTNCCPSLHAWGNITVSPSTLYTYGIVYRCDSGYTSTNYMYRYEYTSNGGTYVTEGGVFNDANRVPLGNGWYYAWGTFTTQATTNWLGHCGTFYYRYATTTDRLTVAKVMIAQGDYSGMHPMYWPNSNSSLSTTQNLKDISGKGTLVTTTSLTYGTNGLFSFNGGTQRIDLSATIGPMGNNWTISAWANSTNITLTQNILSMNGPYFMRIDGSKVRFNVLTDTWLFQAGTTTLSSNTWYFFTMVWNGTAGTWTGYINNSQEFSVAKTGSMNAAYNNFFGYVGYTPQGGEQSNFFGQIPATYYYNRALSADEVTQNFNALRGRYGV